MEPVKHCESSGGTTELSEGGVIDYNDKVFDKLKSIEKRAKALVNSWKKWNPDSEKLHRIRQEWGKEVKRLDEKVFKDSYNEKTADTTMRWFNNGVYSHSYNFGDVLA